MRGQLNIFVGIAVALVSVVAVVIALVVYIAAVLTLKIFGAGGVEVVNTFNTPYMLATMISNANVDGRPMTDALLEASLTKDAAAITKISARISELLGGYDFPYEVRLDVEGFSASCTRTYDSSHKAVDISANCGTPVKAVCNGRLSTLGPGLSGDPVFSGTARGGSEGLEIEHDDKCDVREMQGYRSFYGCIKAIDRRARSVSRGEVIGYVDKCGAEPGTCHLHFGITKGALDRSEDPKICDKLDFVVVQGSSVLAEKGEPEDFAQATVPLMYKTQAINLVVTTNER